MGNEERQFAGKLLACEQALCQFGERVKKTPRDFFHPFRKQKACSQASKLEPAWHFLTLFCGAGQWERRGVLYGSRSQTMQIIYRPSFSQKSLGMEGKISQNSIALFLCPKSTVLGNYMLFPLSGYLTILIFSAFDKM